MSHLDHPLFDLIHQPWTPCREPDGTVTELGLLPTLTRAHEVVGISGDVPTQVFALTRLLLAVLHGALAGPRNLGEWKELWEAETLPVDRIAGYLDRHRDRFDLFHPETPFLQVADLHTSKGESSDLSKLIADVPNGVRFFTSRQGELSLSYAEAARWLVHCQAFDPSGIKSGAVGDDRVKGGKGYPIGVAWSGLLGGLLLEGSTLKETLLLNLMSRDFLDYARDPGDDRPVWEREQVTAAEEEDDGRAPTGPVDLYVWQSRRVRLFPADGRVTRVLIANGERLTPQNKYRVEPHTAWRNSEAQARKPGVTGTVYMPREHDPDRAIWRGLASLLPAESSRQRGGAGKWLSPGILEWLGHLSNEGRIAKDHRVRVRAIGMVYGSNSSVTADIVHDTLALRALLAERDAGDLTGVVVACVGSAEQATQAVGGLAGDLVVAAGGDGTGARSRTMEQVYALLDPIFRRWLLTVTADADEIELRADWQKQVLQVVRETANDLLTDVPPACWEGRVVRQHVFTAAHAEARYWKSLRLALPSVFPSDEPDAAA